MLDWHRGVLRLGVLVSYRIAKARLGVLYKNMLGVLHIDLVHDVAPFWLVSCDDCTALQLWSLLQYLVRINPIDLVRFTFGEQMLQLQLLLLSCRCMCFFFYEG